MTLTGIEGLDRPRIRAILQRASKIGAYIGVMAGVLDSMTGRAAAATDTGSTSTFSIIAYVLGIAIIVISVLVIRLMVKYYNRMTYKNAIQDGKDAGKEELLQEQLEEELEEEEEEEEPEEEEEEEEKEDIDYDAAMDDLDKYSDTMGDDDKDQPLVENINKFVTGYKFLKPPDVAVLSLTKRFDEYEVSMALPEKRKGASKISEFIPFDSNIRKEIMEEFDGISQLNNSMVAMPEMGGMGPIITSRMDGLGKRISETFIPEGVLNNLKTIKDPIIIETNDGELLWETIHDGDNYIALKHPLGRVLKTKEEARVNDFERGEKLKFLLVANPTSDLDSTEREAEYIESILSKRAVIDKLTREEATSENILAALSSGKYDVIHYAGHADSESEGEAVLVTANGRLPSSEIKKAITGRPYVYLNACGSGRESMDESKDYTAVSDTEGLASAFILGGAVGFMGAMWRLPDKSAAEFSVKFYEGLIDNLKVGEACRQARLELIKQNPSDITWAAFLQYGDPVQRLREKKEKEAETDDNVDEDADIEVVDEEGYEEWGDGEEEEEEEEEEDQLTDEERLEQYMKWIGGGLEHMKNHKYEDAISAFDSAIGLDPGRYNAWHLTGNALRELRRYNEALELYDKAIERDAMVDEIWYDMALALGAVGRFDEANDAVKIVESLKVGRVKEWLKKANELMIKGGVSDAMKIYDRILRENDSYPLAWYLKGVAHMELGEKQRAIQAFDNSISHAKNFSMSYHKKAEVLFGLGKKEEALETVEKAIALNPVNEDALLLKATILIELQLNKPALEAIDLILKLNKTNADAQLRKADILRRYNKNKAALDSYDRMIRLNPENTEAWYWRSKLLNELGMKEEDEIQCYNILLDLDIEDPAILKGVGSALAKKEGVDDLKLKWFDKMILYNPNSARVWVNKGTALEALSRPEEALDAYEKALELDPENTAALGATARLYEANGIKDKAIANYARIVKLDSDDYDALTNMSKLQRETGRTVEAQKGFSKLYKVQPENTTVLWNLREIYTELGKRKNALTVSKKLLKLDADNTNNIYAHSRILYEFKNYPEVIKYTDKLVDVMPDDGELLVMRAEAYSNMNKLDAALEIWNRIIELNPGVMTSPEGPEEPEPEPESEPERQDDEPEPEQESEQEPEPEPEPEDPEEPGSEAPDEPGEEPNWPGEGEEGR